MKKKYFSIIIFFICPICVPGYRYKLHINNSRIQGHKKLILVPKYLYYIFKTKSWLDLEFCSYLISGLKNTDNNKKNNYLMGNSSNLSAEIWHSSCINKLHCSSFLAKIKPSSSN